SGVRTKTISGLEGATATSPIETVLCWSKIGVQVMPLLTVFHRPPDAVATYRVVGRPSTTATSTTRPPMLAGPSGRALKPSRRRTSGAGSPAGLRGGAVATGGKAGSSKAAGRRRAGWGIKVVLGEQPAAWQSRRRLSVGVGWSIGRKFGEIQRNRQARPDGGAGESVVIVGGLGQVGHGGLGGGRNQGHRSQGYQGEAEQ